MTEAEIERLSKLFRDKLTTAVTQNAGRTRAMSRREQIAGVVVLTGVLVGLPMKRPAGPSFSTMNKTRPAA